MNKQIRIDRPLMLILASGFFLGLLFLFFVPPWEHYDEPAHFEYAWLIAHRFKLPAIEDFDTNLRLDVGRSLIATRFFEHRKTPQPNLTDPNQPLWMGVNQVEDPPLYYILTAVPLFLLQRFPVEWQLYSGRFVSLLFLLITIFSSYKMTSELTRPGQPLRWLVPLFIALLPGFVEFMTAFNDYPAAIGFFSLWMLSAIYLIHRKWSLPQGTVFLLLTVACIFTQKFLYYILPFVPLVIFLSFLPRRKEWIAWVTSLVLGLALLIVGIQWNDAAFWLRSNPQNVSPKISTDQTTVSSSALQGSVFPDTNWENTYLGQNSGFFQLVPVEISDRLRGSKVTVAAWVWADQEILSYGPGINALYQFKDQWSGFKPVHLSTTPQFISSVLTLPNEMDRLQIWLRTTSPDAPTAKMFFSGVILTEGEFTEGNPPTLNATASAGTWENRSFNNIARNGFFSQSWPYLRPEISEWLNQKTNGSMTIAVSSFFALFLDFKGTGWYLTSTAARIFRTFWATFGWGQINLVTIPWAPQPYLYLLILTSIGTVAGLIGLITVFKRFKSETLFLSLLTIATVLVVLFYGVYTMGGALRFRAYFPAARYIYPAIVPISLLLVSGWFATSNLLIQKAKIPPKWIAFTGIFLLVLLNIYSIFSILKYAWS